MPENDNNSCDVSKPDYKLKSIVLSSDIGQEYIKLDKRIKRNLYLHNAIDYATTWGDPVSSSFPDMDKQLINDTLEDLSDDFIFCEAHKINRASSRRVQRLRSRIEKLVFSGNAIFATLTFTDNVLSSTSQKTRRRYVARFLKSQSEFYVANIDFGSKNGREHYHAVVFVDPNQGIALNQWRKYGQINVKRVRVSDKSPLRISKYISKLTNHAIKETASCNHLIYSRDV